MNPESLGFLVLDLLWSIYEDLLFGQLLDKIDSPTSNMLEHLVLYNR